jgi:hypothetical protein
VASFVLIGPFTFSIGYGFHSALFTSGRAGFANVFLRFVAEAVFSVVRIGSNGYLFLLIVLTAILYRTAMSVLTSHQRQLVASRWAGVPITIVAAAISALTILQVVALFLGPSRAGLLMHEWGIAAPVGAGLTAAAIEVALTLWQRLSTGRPLQANVPSAGGALPTSALATMLRALQVSGGVVAALFALLMFALVPWAATSTQHTLRGCEPEHLWAAVQFVRDREAATGVIPETTEFEDWTRGMDAKGFRFEGNGFTLDKHCRPKASEFCIYFSTGDGFVTYRSWQQSMEKVEFDDSPLPWASGLLVAGLVAALLSKLLLFPRTRRTS